MAEVTDPKILRHFKSSTDTEVSDPEILRRFNGDAPPEESKNFLPEVNQASVKDAIKQVGAGLVSGLEQIPRLPAHLANLVAPLVNSSEDESKRQALLGLIQQNRKAGDVADYLPQPETKLGEYARTGAEFVPGAVAMPGKALVNLGIGAASGMASEGAGQYARENDPGMEAYYRTLAPLAVGGAAALAPNRAARNQASRLVPTIDKAEDASRASLPRPSLEEAISADRDAIKQMGVTLKPTNVSEGIGNIRNGLAGKYGTAERFKSVDDFLSGKQSEFAPPPQRAAIDPRLPHPEKPAVPLNEIDNIRQQLGDIAADAQKYTKTERAAARTAKERIDSLVTPENAASGDAGRAARRLAETRANEAARFRADTVLGRIETGDLNAATAGSGRNVDNAGKQALKALIRPKPGMGRMTEAELAGFDPAEIAQMRKVVFGDTLGNTLRLGGSNAINHGALGAGGLTMAITTGNPAWLIPYLGTGAAKKLSGMYTKRQERILDEMVRARSPAAYRNMYQVTSPPRRLSATGTGALMGLQGARQMLLDPQDDED